MRTRGFTLIELMVVIAIIGMLSSVVFSTVVGLQKDARDKRRVDDLTQIRSALNLYYTDHQHFPRESEGANGNISTNVTFQTMVGSYLRGVPRDPAGIGNDTFFYYYDGHANCGGLYNAIIFVRQLDSPEKNTNYPDFLNTTCSGVLDGEGRGGGEQSYNLILGESGD